MKKSAIQKLTSYSAATNSSTKLVKIGEASQLIGVSIDTLRRWEKRGWLKTVKTPGGTRLYDKEQLIKLNPNLKRGPKSLLTPIAPTTTEVPASKPFSVTTPVSHIPFNHPITLDSDKHILKTSDSIKSTQTISPITKNSDNSPFFLNFKASASLLNNFKAGILSCLVIALLLLPGLLFTNYIKNNQTVASTIEPGTRVLADNYIVKTKDLVQELTDVFSPKLSQLIFGKYPPGGPPGKLAQNLNNNLNPAQQRDLDNIKGGNFPSVKGVSTGSVLQAATPSLSFLEINLDTQINGTATISGQLTAPNIVYSVTPGANITITGDPQNPTISSTGINVPDATNTTKGIASFSSDFFTVTSGAVSIADSSITGTQIENGTVTNSNLQSSSITINTGSGLTGGGSVSLGGSITISASGSQASGVTSITGTANQIIASASTGDITLSLPQDIDTTSDPQFAGVNLNGSSSGTITLGAAANTIDYTFSFPANSGTNGYFLTTDGNGNTSWTAAGAGTGNINGSGTTNAIAKFTAATNIGDSLLTDDGTTFAINTNKFTVTEANGNTSIAGTLDVTGAVTGSSFNGLTITTSTGTLTVANAKTFTASNSLTFTGTDGTTFAFPNASDDIVGRTATQTLTNKTLTSPVITGSPTASGATWTDLGSVTTIDINGGTIDGTNIGASTPGTGAFTTLSTTGATTLGNNSSTVAINSSSWDITTAGVATGLSISGSTNTFSNIPNSALTNSTITIAGDTGSTAIALGGTQNIVGAGPITTSQSSGTLTIDCTTCTETGGLIFMLAASTGSNSTINQGDTVTIAAGTDITTTNNGSGTVTIANTSTLATVTGRGATTTTLVNLNGGIAVDTSNFTVDGTTGAVSTASTITAATDETINGLDISAGAISDVAGYTQSTGAFAFSGGGNFSVDSAAFDVTTAGAVSGVTTLSLSGAISDPDSAVTINDDLEVAGTTGLTFTGTGGQINFTNGETIDNDTNNQINLGLGSSGTLLLTSTTTASLTNSAGALNINAQATGLNLQADGSIDVNIAGGSSSTGCTITNSNGNLACSGTITQNGTAVATGTGTTNTLPKWSNTSGGLTDSLLSDDGTTFAINTDKFTVTEASGNTVIAGTLQVGANNTTITNGTKTAEFESSIIVGDNNNGGLSFRNAAGNGTIFGLGLDSSNNIYLGYNNPNIYLRTNSSGSAMVALDSSGRFGVGDATPASLFTVGSGDLFQINSSGNIVRLGGSGHTFSDSAGTLSITSQGAFNLNSTTSSAITLDSGTTGTVNLGTGNNAKTINLGTGTAGNTINIATDNTNADTINIGSALDTTTLTGAVRIAGLTTNGPVYTSGGNGTLNSEAQLATSRGGTGQDFSATAQGSIPYFNGTGTMAALAPSTAGYVLTTQGAGANPSWTDAGTLGVKWNNIASPDGNQTLAMASNTTTWNWATATTGNQFTATANALTTGSLFNLSSTSTAGDGSKLLNLSRSGTNGSSSKTNYGLYSNITNTGTSSTNIAGYFSASGATNNYGLIVENGNVGIGTTAPDTKLYASVGDTSTSSNTNLLTLAHTISGGGPSIDSETVLLMHQDGSNNSTTFTDSSASAHTMSANGNAKLNTSNAKFGTAGGSFDGTGDYLTSADSADWNFGSGDFTIDTWINLTAAPAGGFGGAVFSQDGGAAILTSLAVVITPARHVRVWAGTGAAWDILNGVDFCDASSVLTTGSYHHFAFVRSTNSWMVFIDGTQCGSTQTASGTLYNSPDNLYIGGEFQDTSGGGGINGYLDEYRISKGIARWTSDFTPPSAAYGSNDASNGIASGILFKNQNGAGTLVSSGQISSILTSVTNTSEQGALAFSVANNSGSIGDPSEVMRIVPGKVGIATTSPDSIFDVNLGTSGNVQLTYNDADGSASTYSRFGVDSSGNLSIDNTGTKTIIADDLQVTGNDLLDSSATTRVSLGSTTTLTNSTTTLSGTSTLTASSLATFTTAATLGMTSTTTLNLGNNATINSNATALNLQADGTPDVNLAGGSAATGCTVANSTGNLTCSGNITGSSSGTVGFWSRSSTTLSPATSNDVVSISSNDTSNPVLSLTSTGATSNAFTLTGNSITTGNLASLTATGMTTGEILDITGTWAPSDGSTNEAIDLNITHTPTSSADNFSSINLTTTDGTALANTIYGINNTLTLTGNADKTGTGIYSTITSTSTGADTLYGADILVDHNAAAAGGKTLYGLRSQITNDGITDVGTVNSYAGYFSNISNSGGTNSAFGVYISGPTGGDENYPLFVDWNTGNTSAITIQNTGSSFTAGASSALYIDLSSNLTSTNVSTTAVNILLDSSTNTGNTTIKGIALTSGALTQNTGNTTTSNLIDLTIPNITQSGGTLVANGLKVTTGTITTAGTQNGLNVAASGVGAGSLNGLNISGITGGSGTETAITVGSGWDTDLSFADTSPTVAIADGGTLSFTDGTNTLCSIADAGSTGNLTCTGNITGASTGTVGYWSRSGTTLSTATSGDNVTTSGNISTTGSGTITSAGLLTGSAGATISGGNTSISGGTISLNASSNNNTNINTGTSTGAVTIGTSAAGAIALSTGSTFGITTTTSPQTYTSAVVTGTGSSSAFVFNASSLTSGTALRLTSTATSGKLVDLNATNTSGTIFNLAYGSAASLAGDLTGVLVDLNSGNVDATNQNLTAANLKVPTVTDTHTSGTKTLTGLLVNFGSGGGINQNGSGGTLEFVGADISMPALTQTAGTLNAYGTRVTTPATITTGGTAYGNYISATGVGAGTLSGIGISGITGDSGTEYALNIGSGWDAVLRVGSTTVINGSGVTQVAGGGTGLASYTSGDLIYATGATTLAKRGIGNEDEVLTVVGGVPTWAPAASTSCSNCIINDPTADQYIAPTGQGTTGLTVRQTSTASPTDDIFQVTDSSGATKYFWVDKDGNVSTAGTSSQTLTLTPVTDTTALTLVGTNVTTQPLQYINANNEEGNIIQLNYGAAQTLANSLTAFDIDLSTNVTSTNQSVMGTHITLPGATNTHTSGTVNITGFSADGGSINQNGAGGTTVFTAFDATIPAITQTAGTLTAYGINVNTPSSITTGGTASALNVTATGVGAGTLNGLNIGSITAGAGTENGIQIGSGWDTNLLFNDTTTNVAVANGGTITIKDSAGNSLCTITDSGSAGDLSCTGTISGSGSVGFWTRTSTTLSPVNAGDDVTTSGNISTSGSGTITSAGAFSGPTATNTINGLIINSGSLSGIAGYTQSTGAFAFSGGGNFSVDSAAFDVTTAGAVSGVTTLSLSGAISDTDSAVIVNDDLEVAGTTGLTFTGTGGQINFTNGETIDNDTNNQINLGLGSSGTLLLTSSTTASITNSAGALGINAQATGLNLQADGSIDVNIAGGSGATGCTITNSNGNLACSGTITQNGTAVATGTGTTNTLPKWSNTSGALTDSALSDNATTLTYSASGGLTLSNTSADLTFGNGEAINNDSDGTLAFTIGGTSGMNVGANGITSLGNVAHSIVNSSGALNIDSNSTGAINIGTSANAKTITIGNSTGASALAFTSGTGSQTFTSSVATTSTTSSAWVFTGNSLSSGTGLYASSTSLTTGKLAQLSLPQNNFSSGTILDLRTTSTGLTGATGTGSLLNLDWTPGSATTATGDLFSLNIGTNGTTTGKLFNILDTSASIFSVSETAFETSLPSNFTSAGDVAIAYDINFTNPTASYIKSAAPLSIVAGETFNSSNLTLGTYNQGTIVFSSNNTTTTAADLSNSTLTTGTGLNIALSGSSQTTASALKITQSGTTTGFTGNFVDITGSSTTGAGNLLSLTSVNTTNGNALSITANALTTGEAVTVSSTGTITNGGNLVQLTANSATTGDVLNISATGLTTGQAIEAVGSTTVGVTSNFVHLASDVGSAGSVINLSPDFSGSAVTGYGLRIQATDSTTNNNVDYGINSVLTLTGNAAKTGRSMFSSISSNSTTADSIAALELSASQTGALASGTRNVYGLLTQPTSSNATSASSTQNIYGVYSKASGNISSNGTLNGYGLYVANGTYDTGGTSAQYGLWIESITGADTNEAIHTAGGKVSFACSANFANAGGVTSCSDYAEVYDTADSSLDKGDLIVVDTTNDKKVAKSNGTRYQNEIIGIYSTSPGLLIGDGKIIQASPDEQLPSGKVPVALTGRVPVKVSTENGPISKGDFLTSSSIPGVAMRATQPGLTVGRAMENYSGSGVNKIQAFVNITYADPANALANLLIDNNGNLLTSTPSFEKITVSGDIKVGGLASASNFALDASNINRVGALASLPVNSNGKVSLADAVNSINSQLTQTSQQTQTNEQKILGLETTSASQSAHLAEVEQLSNQAIQQSNSLNDKVASTSANLASLSDKINDLLASISGDSNPSSPSATPNTSEIAGLTPPDVLFATGSATLANINITEKTSTLNLEALDATVSTTFKSLGETFLGQTTIAGDLSVDGTMSFTNGDSINAFPVLYFQNNPLAQAVDFFNGAIALTKDGLIAAESLALGDQSLGEAIIPAGQTEITIHSSFIIQNSKIFLTATSPVNGTLYSDKIISGQSFKVKLSAPNLSDVKFNWMIIQQK